jgi:hypothetical protein
MKHGLQVGILVVMLPVAAATAESKLDLSQRFLLLATTKTATMQKELDEAAAAGYRVIVGSPTSGGEMVVILEKMPNLPQPYEYFLLATTRTSTMQRELNDAAARGFRLLPKTIIAKEQPFGAREIVLLMEKAPGTTNRARYLLLATSRTSTMQREMTQAVEDGYEVVAMVSRGEHIVILEKRAGPSGP